MFLEEQLRLLADRGGCPSHVPELRSALETFVTKEVLPRERDVPATARELPPQVLAPMQDAARRAGYWMLEAPTEFGGAGLGAFESVVAREELARYTYSFASRVTGREPPASLYGGSPEQLDRYVRPAIEHGWNIFTAISEPGGGSDPARSIRTSAVQHGDEYVLNGRKMWTTHADEAPYGVVFARTSEGRHGITAFVVASDNPGLSVSPVPVLRDHWSTEVALEDCRIPVADRVGVEGQGFELAGRWTQRARLAISAFCLGVAESSIKLALDWVRNRSTFGAPLATRQAVQFAIADAVVDLQAARWLLWQAAWLVDDGKDARVAVSSAKYRCTEVGFQVVDSMMQLLGGMGVAKEMPLEHWFRDVRVCRIVEGPTDIHRYVIARDVVGSLATAVPTVKVADR